MHCSFLSVRPSQDNDDNLDKVASSVMPIVSQRLLSKIQKRVRLLIFVPITMAHLRVP